MTDTRWHFGGPYGYEFDCQIIPPVGSGLASRLESQAGVFLGQLEEYRRANNLQSLTWYSQDSAGNIYEYGVIMGRPYAVIRVNMAPILTTPDNFIRKFAYCRATSSVGDTFGYRGLVPTLIKTSDELASINVRTYHRISPVQADVVLYNSRISYKGKGLSLAGVSGFAALAAMRNDPAPEGLLAASAVMQLWVFSDEVDRMHVQRGTPTIGSASTPFHSSDSLPSVATSNQFTIIGQRPVVLCANSAYVCCVDTDTFETYSVYRYLPEGANPAGSLVASYSSASQDSFDLGPYATSSVVGTSFSGEVSFEDSTEIRQFPTASSIQFVSANPLSPLPLQGTITRSAVSSASMTFTTPEFFTETGIGPSYVMDAGVAYVLNNSSSFSNSFTGSSCGVSVSYDESITTTRNVVSDRVAHSEDQTNLSGFTSQTIEETFTVDIDRSEQGIVFCDAAFGVSVAIRRRIQFSRESVRDQTYSGGFADIIPWDNVPSPAVEDFSRFWRSSYDSQFDEVYNVHIGSSVLSGTNTTAQSYSETRSIVVYRNGSAVTEREYYAYQGTDDYWNFLDIDSLRIANGETGTGPFIQYFRLATQLNIAFTGSGFSTDTAKVVADDKSISAEVIYRPFGSGSDEHVFIDGLGQDWASISGVATGTASAGSKIFRV